MSASTYPAGGATFVCHGHSRPVPQIHFTNIVEDSYWVASACLDGKPMLRNGVTGDWVGTFEGHKGAVWWTSLDHTATKAATASADFTAKLWDALTGDNIHTFKHAHIVKTSEFSPDGKRLLTGGQEKTLKIFDLEKPTADPIVLTGHSQSVRASAWLNDNVALSSAQDKTLRVWDTRTGACTKVVEYANNVTNIEISKDKSSITICAGKKVIFADPQTLLEKKSFTFDTEMESASLHPSGAYFCTGGEDFWVRVIDFNTGKELDCQKGHHGPVHSVRWAPDGSRYASGSEDGTVRIWAKA